MCINFLNQFFLFSHLNSLLHNLVVELCRALKIFQKTLRFFSKVTRSFVDIELLTLSINAKFHFYFSIELSLFGMNKLYSLIRTRSINNNILNIHKKQIDHLYKKISFFHLFRFLAYPHISCFVF